MRRLLAGLVVVIAVCSGCSGGSDPAPTASTPSSTSSPSSPSVTLASLGLDWPDADGALEPGDPPAVPAGFDTALRDRMASILTDWAAAAALDSEAWHSKAPLDVVAADLPASVATALRDQTKGAVSPRLAVANVFGDDVTVGRQQVTSAWKVTTAKDGAGKPFMVLELQTRTAYEVTLGDDGPTRVIGVLRVQGLTAYADTTDDFGVTGGWQEFGAGDCALATNDELLPDSDPDTAAKDLTAFVAIGDAPELVMPRLKPDENVDKDYLARCRAGAV